MNPTPAYSSIPPARRHCLSAALPLGAALLALSTSAAETPSAWQLVPARSSRTETAPAKGAMVLASATARDAEEPEAPVAPPREPRPIETVVNATRIAEDAPVPAANAQPAKDGTEAAPPSPIRTQVGEKALYSFRATDTELKAALSMFARANDLNIVPDHDVTGQVTLDVRNLPLHKVLQALLEAYDYVWEDEDGLIRVRARETREFWIDYLRLTRKGVGSSSATLASGMGGGKGGGGGGAAQGGSSVNLTADNPVSFWTELREEISKMLTQSGKESLAINMTAGVIQITDRPSALKRVRKYVDSLSTSVARQVEIRARIFDVSLRDQFQFGIDWEHAAQAFGGVATTGASTIVASPIGGAAVKDSALSFVFENTDTAVILQALQEQGEVNVVSQPRIRVVNNQTAMIKVGTETPFFTSRTTYLPGASTGTTTSLQEEEVSTITVGTILSITPQISSNEWVTLDIAPVLTSLVETVISPSETTTAPVLDIKQASTLVRCRNGATVIIGGLMQDEKGTTLRKVPLMGDIPLLGHLFRGRHDYKLKRELVISITPIILE